MSFVVAILDPGGTPVVSAVTTRPGKGRRSRSRSIWLPWGPWAVRRNTLNLRGRYRVFNAAEYRLYRDNAAPPGEDDTPFATATSLPTTPADTFADGIWWLSMSWFNGVLDSGFLPLGPRGETYLKVELSAGEELTAPPAGPADWRLEQVSGGVVRIVAGYYESGDDRAHEWAVAYTTNESDPPADTPTVTADLSAADLAVLSYDLPAQADGITVKVRLQTRRNDGDHETPVWRYSADSTIKTLDVATTGPTEPLAGTIWPGDLPEGR